MDFDSLLSAYKSKACILSVDKLSDDRYGNIRIVAGNQAHCEDMLRTMNREFIPNSPYAEYFPENRNFEDFCYRSAILGQPLHTYVQLPQMGLWLNMFLLPLESDEEDKGYCLYTYDVTFKADSEQQASVSADTSSVVLQTCIKLRGSTNIRTAIGEVVDDIRKICDSDQCCILLVDHNNRICENFAESLNKDSVLLPIENYLDENFYDITGTWKDTIGDSTCIILKDQNDMDWLKSTNPVWYESLVDAKVYNVVLFPLSYNGRTLGYIWALNFNTDNTVKIKETLELTTFFIASEIANYQLLNRLEVMSTMDMLTKTKNRNAMNNMVSDIIVGKCRLKTPYAVIFADLNGLKRVNDESGHGEGDNYLKTAANILNGVFFESDVYRAGGDEFMILAQDMGEDELKKRIEKLEEQAERDNVHFAVGTFIVDECDDIRTAMRVADERMYKDKEAYYKKYPERKYR